MTLEEAHKRLDEAYAKNENINVRFGFRGKIHDSLRVTASLIEVAEVAKSESSLISLSRKVEE